MRVYKDRRVTSPTWDPSTASKQALKLPINSPPTSLKPYSRPNSAVNRMRPLFFMMSGSNVVEISKTGDRNQSLNMKRE